MEKISGWTKTKKGTVKYKGKSRPFRLVRLSVIIEKMISESADDNFIMPDASIWQIYQNMTLMMNRRGLFKSILGTSTSEVLGYAKGYVDFIHWFDGAIKTLTGFLDFLDKYIPPIKPFTTFVKESIAIYEFVRKVFPID